jgi:ribosomal protein S6
MNEENTETTHEETLADESAVYELGYHILPTVRDEGVVEEVGKLKSAIEKQKGVLIMDENPALIRLAYPIDRVVSGKHEKYDTAYFGWVKCELPLAHVLVLKRAIEENDNILRFLLIRTVREDTRAPKRPVPTKAEERDSSATSRRVLSEKKNSTPMSDEELDKTIKELVVE